MFVGEGILKSKLFFNSFPNLESTTCDSQAKRAQTIVVVMQLAAEFFQGHVLVTLFLKRHGVVHTLV